MFDPHQPVSPLAFLCLAPAWIIGTAIAVAQTSLWHANVYAVFACGIVSLWWVNRWVPRQIVWVIVALSLGFASAGWQGASRNAAGIAPDLEGVDQWVRGHVQSLPSTSDDGMHTRFIFRVADRRDDQGAWLPWPVDLQLAYYKPRNADGLRDIEAGSAWVWPVRLKALHAQRNPGGRDSRLGPWSAGVVARGYVRAVPVSVSVPWAGGTSGSRVLRWRAAVKDAINRHLHAAPRVASLVSALTVGDQGAIQSGDWRLFRVTGVSHLVSISGLHISLFAWLAAAVCGGLWRVAVMARLPGIDATRHALWAGVGALILATVYAVFSGWGLPAQRTIFMLACFIGLRLLGLRWPWWVTWLIAMALVLMVEPWGLRRPGFWLSFIAVATLFGRPDPIQTVRSGNLWQRVVFVFVTQWRLTLTLAPLTWLFFGQISIIGLLVNALAIPWVTFLVMPLAFTAVFSDALIAPLVWFSQRFFTGLEWAASAPFGLWQPGSLPMPLLGVVAVWALFALWWPRGLGRWLLLSALLPLALYAPARPAAGAYHVLAFDVGQGSAILVRTAQHTLLFDAGARYASGYDIGEQVLLPYLIQTHERIDRLILSHADSDHVGGSRALLQAPLTADADVLASFPVGDLPFQSADQAGLPTQPWQACQGGVRWQWDGVSFEVMSPAPMTFGPAGANVWLVDEPRFRNGRSCVLRISTPKDAVWLTGDMTRAGEVGVLQRLEASALAGLLENPKASNRLVMASHHGSQSANSDAWLAGLQPSWLVVQAGYLNRYRHPAAAVQKRWAAAGDAWGTRWVETAWCGAATWQSTAADTLVCEREAHPRSWQHMPP